MKQEAKRLLTVNALYALIPLLLIVVPRIFAKAEFIAYGAAYNAYMLLVEFCVVALPALVWMMTRQGRPAAVSFWKAKPSIALLLIVPLALCAYFCANGITVMWFLLLNRFGITQMPQSIPAPQNGVQLGLGFALIALTPALCEEFFFRGVLQPALHRHIKPWLAIVLGGCIFGLVHGQIVAMPAHVLLGMGLCLVAYWTRSVWYTALWHLMQNGIAVAISFASEGILQMTGGSEASAAMLTEQPGMMLLSAGMMAALFGMGTLLFLALFLFVTYGDYKKIRAQDAPLQKVPVWSYAPLIAAAGGILYLYITGTIPLMGGGV